MKKTIFLILLITFAVMPGNSFADYKCLLKSGEEFFAADYWVDKVDKSVIRVDVNGNMVRMPRDLFNYISPANRRSVKVRTAIKRIGFKNRAGFDLDNALKKAMGRFDDPVNDKDSPYRQEANDLQRQMAMAREEFQTAKERGDEEVRQEARKKILELTESQKKLLEDIKNENKGKVPDWWEQEPQG